MLHNFILMGIQGWEFAFWANLWGRSFLVSGLRDLLICSVKKNNKLYILIYNIDNFEVFLPKFHLNLCVNCSFLWANERFAQKNRVIRSSICSLLVKDLSKSLKVAPFLWANWANRSQLLFCPEQPERFAQCPSFVMSDQRKTLAVAH